MELSPEEAEIMQQNDGLIVEEDIIISANSLEEEAITEVEMVLTESEDESQSVSEETEVIEETETNCFKKCVVLNKGD